MGLRGVTLRSWYTWESPVSGARHVDRQSKISLSKQPSFNNPIELLADLVILRDPSSIGPGQSEDSESELAIRSLKVSLYLLEIVKISDFPSAPPTAYLITRFLKIVIIQFWRKKRVLAKIFPRQV